MLAGAGLIWNACTPEIELVSGVTFFFEDGVTDADRVRIKEGISAAQSFLDMNLGGVKRGGCADVRIDPTRTGTATTPDGNRFILFTSDTGWRPAKGSYPPWHLTKATAHEYGHTWQHQFSRYLASPLWIREGSAEYIAVRSAVDSGAVTESAARSYALGHANGQPAGTLQSYEDSALASQLNYGLVFLAVERLTAGVGAGSLRTYAEALAQGATWQRAFQNAFRTPADQYYADFEGYRSRGFSG